MLFRSHVADSLISVRNFALTLPKSNLLLNDVSLPLNGLGSIGRSLETEKVELAVAPGSYVSLSDFAPFVAGFDDVADKVDIRRLELSDANPYFDTQYFIDRKFQRGMKYLSGRFKKVWKEQNGCCFHCGLPMDIGEDKEIFYKTPINMGGTDDVKNMAYVHKHCQQIFLERRAKA